MNHSEVVSGALIEGAIGALISIAFAFLLSRFVRDLYGRALLVMLLFTATGAYFGFAVAGQAGPLWLLLELAHIIGFGALGLLSLHGSSYWLAAGWVLHPVWDVGLHYLGPGHTFAPFTYTIACVSYDLVVAAYVVIVYELIRPVRLGFRTGEAATRLTA